MIQRANKSDRRVLTFPVVRPCESISPAILLTSLVTLSRSICGSQSRFFATQRTNARESIRQVGILLLFFEHLRDHPQKLNLIEEESFVLTFSELHFALQKLLLLLEDCSRDGARIWVLMKSQFVAKQFQTAIRCIATALDVLSPPPQPLHLEAAEEEEEAEVRLILRMLGRQARKARCDVVEASDQLAVERMILILNQFENGFEPERGLIKRVLDYLGIRTWSDCNREVRFLEDEIALSCSDGGGGGERREREGVEAPLLNSLLGVMCYCRGVIFEDLGSEECHGTGDRLPEETLSCLNPEDFLCPISLELMTDPVTVSTGQTYDRSSIQKWLKSGNMICPKTGEKLISRELVPNSVLKKLIQQFCADNGISVVRSGRDSRNISRTTLLGSPTAREAVQFLTEFLTGRLIYGTEEQKNKAAFEMRLLAKFHMYSRSVLVEVGAVSPLLNLLTSTDPTAQENSIASLLKLSKHSPGRNSIVKNGGLDLILTVLRDGLKMESRRISAAIIFYLASVDTYRRLIGRNKEAITGLIELLRDGTVCGKRTAMAALYGLLLHRGNQERALKAGIIPLLIDIIIIASQNEELISDGLAIVATLAKEVKGSDAILQTKGLNLVMSLVRSSSISGTGKEYCVSILFSLCINRGGEVVGVIAKESQLIMPSLYGLSVDGKNPNVGKKAWALINMLQRYRESCSSRLMDEAVCKEGMIRGGQS